MKLQHLLAGSAIALCSAAAFGQTTGYTIAGSMSNFDCSNHCDYPCDEIEIDIDGIHPEDVLHTYRNGNYGSPSVTLSPDGTYTVVSYRNPQHLTAVGSIEHYGVTIRGAVYYGPQPYHTSRVRWYRDGHVATVNGQVPNPGGGSSPATQPSMPTISATVTPGSHGAGGASLTVTNTDPAQSIWIKRRAQVTTAAVTLEALMPNDPLITTTVQIDPSPIKLAPAQTVTLAHDLIDVEEEQSVIFSAQYYQNIITASADPFDPNNHEAVGPELGNIMTSTLASPNLPCEHSMPTVDLQPASVTQAADSRVDLRVSGRGDDLSPIEYLWLKDGVPIVDGNGVSGATTNHLRINKLKAENEGFYSVRLTNVCATIMSDSALVFITGHNTPPARIVSATCPTITSQPQSAFACSSTPVNFGAGADGTGPLNYQWITVTDAGQPGASLSNGVFTNPATGLSFTVSGANTNQLTISNIHLGNNAPVIRFATSATNGCGNATSNPATLTVLSCACNPADLVGVGGTYLNGAVDVPADGQLTIEDFLVFLSAFGDATGCPGQSRCNPADIAGVGATYANGAVDIGPDGDLTIEDFLTFLSAFGDSTGCP